jgi:hypothetical protein
MRRLRLAALALLGAMALAAAPALAAAASGPAVSRERPEGRAAGADSPWPGTRRLAPNVQAIRSVVDDLERKVALMRQSADRYADWASCIHGVPISEYGDKDRQFGYAYDEVDGTGRGRMSALAVDRTSRPRKEDYLFLSFSRRDNCRSDAPLPGGTAEPASVRPAEVAAGSLARTLTSLERRVRFLKRAERRLLAASERFDEWESCVSWVPVTEYGDPDGKFGYLFGPKSATTPLYRTALTVDRSPWDDPDYMFLAFVGGDRPGRTCQDEPGEAVD